MTLLSILNTQKSLLILTMAKTMTTVNFARLSVNATAATPIQLSLGFQNFYHLMKRYPIDYLPIVKISG